MFRLVWSSVSDFTGSHLRSLFHDRNFFAFLSIHSSEMSTSQRPVVFMDVNIGETPAGRLKMELFSDIVPKFVHV